MYTFMNYDHQKSVKQLELPNTNLSDFNQYTEVQKPCNTTYIES